MLRNLFCIFVAITWITFLMPFVLIAMLIAWDTNVSIWMARRLWSPVLLWAGGARVVVSGVEHVDPARPTIFVSNHQSTIDIPALFVALPVNLRFVAKSGLRWVPVMGWYMWLAKYVFIDRSNPTRAIASLDAAGALIRSGISVVLFPEGTRSTDGRILPFKKGPFALALKAGVSVCPVTIEGSGRVMPKNSWNITPGEIRIKVGAPINPASFDEANRDGLLTAVRDVVIRQSLELGGAGGDSDDAIAVRGQEGIGRARRLSR